MPITAKLPDGRTISVPDDTTPDELDAIVNESAARDMAVSHAPEAAKAEHPHARVARLVGENLPAIGGAIGGALGAVGGPVVAAGTAALGGAAGRAGQKVVESIRRITQPRNLSSLVGEQPQESTGAMLGDIATEGAIQGGLQAAGGLAGKGLARGGERLYSGLLKASKAVKQEYPTVVKTLMDARAPVSRGGSAKIDAALGQSAQRADDLINANANAAPIKAREIVSEFGDTVKELRKRADIGQPSEMARVGERGRRIVAAERNGGIPVKRAQELKRTAQSAAAAGYRQAERGAVKEVGADTLLDKDVARGFRAAIEQRVPGIADVNRETQALMGAQRALQDALSREGNNFAAGGMRDLIAVGAGAGLGGLVDNPEGGAGAGLLLRLLTAPNAGSRIAIGARELGNVAQPLIPNALRLLMSSHGETQ